MKRITKTVDQDSKQPLGPVMLDVVGTVLNEDDIRRIRHPLTGGVILFARNYENRAQLTALTARHPCRPARRADRGRPRRRPRAAFQAATALPGCRRCAALGELWERDVLKATRMATAVGFVLAAELRACGVDLSFTPVLDLDYGESSVIGDRAFHRDPRVVSLLAKSLNHGLALAGMANCGKHFPGHGYVAGRFARGDSGRSARPQGNPGGRRRALRLARHEPGGGDAGARDLSGGGPASGRFFEKMAAACCARISVSRA